MAAKSPPFDTPNCLLRGHVGLSQAGPMSGVLGPGPVRTDPPAHAFSTPAPGPRLASPRPSGHPGGGARLEVGPGSRQAPLKSGVTGIRGQRQGLPTVGSSSTAPVLPNGVRLGTGGAAAA